MFTLNKPDKEFTHADLTSEVANRLLTGGVNVVQVNMPVLSIDQAYGPVVLEIKSEIVDDIDEAIETFIRFNPLVLFLYEVTQEKQYPKAKYIIRYQLIDIKNLTN